MITAKFPAARHMWVTQTSQPWNDVPDESLAQRCLGVE